MAYIAIAEKMAEMAAIHPNTAVLDRNVKKTVNAPPSMLMPSIKMPNVTMPEKPEYAFVVTIGTR
jgi:hypothetical protein